MLDAHEAYEFLALYPQSFIGGSFIVDPSKAKDIDIIVPEWSNDPEAFRAAGFIKHENDADDKYADDDLQRIAGVWRNGDINLIVIRAVYYVAYRGAVAAMEKYPGLFETRDQRIALHIELCRDAAALCRGGKVVADREMI